MKSHTFKSYRLFGYDYTQQGEYFITICTANRKHYFGTVIQGKMKINKLGEIVTQTIQNIPLHFNVEISNFVVMPNHIHMIVELWEQCSNAACCGSTSEKNCRLSPGSVSVIVRSFKSETTKQIRKLGFSDFSWQPRFYDHVIRNDKSFAKIEEYISLNPLKWEYDRFFNKGDW